MTREKEKAGCKEHLTLGFPCEPSEQKKRKKPSLADQEQAERGTQRERNLRPVFHASHPPRAQRQQGSAKAENEPKEKRQSTRGKSLTLCHGYRRNKKRVSHRRKRRRRGLPKMQGERLTACFPQAVTRQAPETTWFSSTRQERKRNWRRKVTHKLPPGTSQPMESSKSTTSAANTRNRKCKESTTHDLPRKSATRDPAMKRVSQENQKKKSKRNNKKEHKPPVSASHQQATRQQNELHERKG